MGEALITRRGGNSFNIDKAELQHITTITLSNNELSKTVTLPKKLSAYKGLSFDTFVTYTATGEGGANANVYIDIGSGENIMVGNTLIMLVESYNYPFTGSVEDHNYLMPQCMKYNINSGTYDCGILTWDGNSSGLTSNTIDFMIPETLDIDTFSIYTHDLSSVSGLSNVSISVVISGVPTIPTGTITDNRIGSGQFLMKYGSSSPFDKTVTPDYVKYDYIITYKGSDGTSIYVVLGANNYITLLEEDDSVNIKATDTLVGASSVYTSLNGHVLTIMAVPKCQWITS